MRITRIRTAILAVGFALSLVAVAPMSASATTSAEIDADGIMEVAPGTSSAELSEHIDEALHALVGKQTPEEIAELKGRPFTTYLADPNTGEVLSAVNTAPSQQSRAISWLAPGCGTAGSDTSMCIKTTDNSQFGYIGIGIKDVSIANSITVTSGSRVGSVTTSANRIFLLTAWEGVRFTQAATIVKITRG